GDVPSRDDNVHVDIQVRSAVDPEQALAGGDAAVLRRLLQAHREGSGTLVAQVVRVGPLHLDGPALHALRSPRERVRGRLRVTVKDDVVERVESDGHDLGHERITELHAHGLGDAWLPRTRGALAARRRSERGKEEGTAPPRTLGASLPLLM